MNKEGLLENRYWKLRERNTRPNLIIIVSFILIISIIHFYPDTPYVLIGILVLFYGLFTYKKPSKEERLFLINYELFKLAKDNSTSTYEYKKTLNNAIKIIELRVIDTGWLSIDNEIESKISNLRNSFSKKLPELLFKKHRTDKELKSIFIPFFG